MGGPRGHGKQTFAVESLPDSRVLRLRVSHSDGPPEFCVELDDEAVSAGESLSVDLGAAQDGFPLRVQLSFTASRAVRDNWSWTMWCTIKV